MAGWGTERDPVGFWTILFAVAGGVLLADLVRLLLAAMLAHAALSAFTESLGKANATTPGHLPARPGLIDRQSIRDVRLRLPGPVSAKSLGVSWACIDGHIAERNGAGWTQRSPLEPCVAESE